MIKSYLVAAIALATIAGVAVRQFPSLNTASPGPVFGDITKEANLQPNAKGVGIMGPFWITLNPNVPTRNDDVPKTIDYARLRSKTVSR
jgi:hypothetical protein